MSHQSSQSFDYFAHLEYSPRTDIQCFSRRIQPWAAFHNLFKEYTEDIRILPTYREPVGDWTTCTSSRVLTDFVVNTSQNMYGK